MTKDKNLHIGLSDHKKPISVSVERGYGEVPTLTDGTSLYPIVGRTTVTINLIGIGGFDQEYLDSAFKMTARALGVKTDDELCKPKPKRVILNAPATIVFFSDGSKVVSKAHGGDTFDPVFGIMACALRKTSNNRESIDVWEPVIGYLASFLGDADDCRIVARMLEATADALELDGVADAVAECDATEYGGDPIVGNDDDGRSTIRTLMYD